MIFLMGLKRPNRRNTIYTLSLILGVVAGGASITFSGILNAPEKVIHSEKRKSPSVNHHLELSRQLKMLAEKYPRYSSLRHLGKNDGADLGIKITNGLPSNKAAVLILSDNIRENSSDEQFIMKLADNLIKFGKKDSVKKILNQVDIYLFPKIISDSKLTEKLEKFISKRPEVTLIVKYDSLLSNNEESVFYGIGDSNVNNASSDEIKVLKTLVEKISKINSFIDLGRKIKKSEKSDICRWAFDEHRIFCMNIVFSEKVRKKSSYTSNLKAAEFYLGAAADPFQLLL